MRSLLLTLMIGCSISTVAQDFELVGQGSKLLDKCYQLTLAQTYKRGAIWASQKLNLTRPFQVTAELNFGCKPSGADGIALVFQNDTAGTHALGGGGGGMAYGYRLFSTTQLPLVPSFAVEFDTWDNSHDGYTDMEPDHVSLFVDGKQLDPPLYGPVAALPGNGELEDCEAHYMEFSWNPDDHQIQVRLDCRVVVDTQFDISQFVFGSTAMIHWGFTAATGIAYNEHKVCNPALRYTESRIDSLSICAGESVQLSVPYSGPVTWDQNPTLSCTICESPTATPPYNTVYKYQVIDLCGASIRDSVVVVIDPACDNPCPIAFPNAFTPNGDGINDRFQPLSSAPDNISSSNFRIYNRWGELIFESNDLAIGWDGTYRDEPAESGVYTWVCKGRCAEGSFLEYGNVTLIR